MWKFPDGYWSIGVLIGLGVLLLCIILAVVGGSGMSSLELGLIGALALSRLT